MVQLNDKLMVGLMHHKRVGQLGTVTYIRTDGLIRLTFNDDKTAWFKESGLMTKKQRDNILEAASALFRQGQR